MFYFYLRDIHKYVQAGIRRVSLVLVQNYWLIDDAITTTVIQCRNNGLTHL